ncbi:MAG: AI-2E family transporter [Pirellulales bacterium]|nr:AI-2E family transporter [Pirellulales bacterium]
MADDDLQIERRKFMGRVFAGTLVVVGVVGAFALAYVCRSVIFYLFAAIVIATALEPFVVRLMRLRMSRAAAVALLYCTLLVAGLAATIAIVPALTEQVGAMIDRLPETYQAAREQLLQVASEPLARMLSRIPPTLPKLAEEEAVAGEALESAAQALNYSGLIARGLFATLATLLLAFYWSLLSERTLRAVLLATSPERRDAVRELLEGMQAKVGAYVRGQGVLCLVVGVMSLGAYWLIGLPSPLALGAIAGVLEAVPIFGPALGALPAATVALSVSPGQLVWVLVAAVVIQQLENYVLVPRVMDRAVGVNGLVTLLAIAGFGALLGIAGAVLAIPLAAILQLVLQRYLLSREALEPPRVVARDAGGKLRYQLQQLVQDVRLYVRDKSEASSDRNDTVEERIEVLARDLDHALEVEREAAVASGAL